MKDEQVTELLLQALETELGGVEVYKTALKCVVNTDLQEELNKYLEQTTHHVEVVRRIFEDLDLDPDTRSVGREVVHDIGAALVAAMQKALASGPPQAAQLVAAECVTLAETKDHLNWELIGQLAENIKGDRSKVLRAAFEEVEGDEDEHLYHSMGWGRELWIQSLGMKAVLPPPEERKDVKTAIGAARAKQARAELI
jgi:bacterioferritin (cytochrome b1)